MARRLAAGPPLRWAARTATGPTALLGATRAPDGAGGARRGTAEDAAHAVDEGGFHRIANATIEAIQEVVEEVVDDHVESGDVSYGDGVLTVFLGDDRGTYVLNKQTPNRQLWLSSPVTGPFRYDYAPPPAGSAGDADEADAASLAQLWVCQRDGHALGTKLREEFQQLIPHAPPVL